MSPKLLVALLATAQASPTLQPQSVQGVAIDVPSEWKLLVKPDIHNVTMSAGITTSITLYWYDYVSGATPDIMLDILVGTVHDQLPIGDIHETSRTAIRGLANPWELVRGKQADAEVGAMGYTMKVGMVTVVDQPSHRMVAAFLVAPPDAFAELGGTDRLAEVARSLRLDTDPLQPVPAWYWHAEPPVAIARPAPVAIADANGAARP